MVADHLGVADHLEVADSLVVVDRLVVVDLVGLLHRLEHLIFTLQFM